MVVDHTYPENPQPPIGGVPKEHLGSFLKGNSGEKSPPILLH